METSEDKKKKTRTGEVNKYIRLGRGSGNRNDADSTAHNQVPRSTYPLPRHFVACLFGMRLSRKYIMHTTITLLLYTAHSTTTSMPCTSTLPLLHRTI